MFVNVILACGITICEHFVLFSVFNNYGTAQLAHNPSKRACSRVFLALPRYCTGQDLCNCWASVTPCVPSGRRMLLLRVCCRGSGGQEKSLDCCTEEGRQSAAAAPQHGHRRRRFFFARDANLGTIAPTFLPRDAMRYALSPCVRPSVRLSVHQKPVLYRKDWTDRAGFGMGASFGLS